jgi:hypothetical protein
MADERTEATWAQFPQMDPVQHVMRTSSPPAGWYADPWNVDPLRWWDGHQWTGHTSPRSDSGSESASSSRDLSSDRNRATDNMDLSHQGPQATEGWYPDPLRTGAVRWWNGHEWSQHGSVESSPGSVVLTGTGYRINAWFITLFWAAAAIGCLVLVPLAVGSLHKHADSRSNSIGLIVLCVLGVVCCLFLAWVCSRKIGGKTSFDATGIRGLAITGRPRNRFEKSFPKVDRRKSVTPWEDVDHVERVYNPGADGGGTYGIKVHLNDGRTASAYVWSARESTMSEVVSRLEEARQSAARRSIGTSDSADGGV